MSKAIPMKYRKGKAKPVRTVGELVEQLNELPKHMLITHGFSDRVKVVATLYNGESQPRLLLEEIEEDDEL